MRNKLLLLAGALVVIGVVTIFLQPGPPPAECVPDGQPTSGFYDPEQDCPVSPESWNEIAEYQSSPKPFRIAGLLIVVVGVGTAVAAPFVGRRRSSEPGTPSA